MTGIFEPGNSLPTYRVRSHNAATASENKIHDNDVAKQYGFSGGLVPGVTVYAYMSQPVVSAFGAAFLERGRMSARFMKPFYELEWCTVSSTVTANDASGISLEFLEVAVLRQWEQGTARVGRHRPLLITVATTTGIRFFKRSDVVVDHGVIAE